MGRIVRDLKICGTKKCKVVPTLFDSGCTDNFIRPELADELGIVEIIRKDWVITSMSTEIPKTMEIELLEMDLLGQKVPKPRFLVVDAEYQLTIGAVPMQRYGIELIMVKEKPEIKFLHPRATYASMATERIGERKTNSMDDELRKIWDETYKEARRASKEPEEAVKIAAKARDRERFENEKLNRLVRIKAQRSDWEALFKWIDEGRVTTEDQLEHAIEERPFATPAGYERIPLDQVPDNLVFKENTPEQYWFSLNVYEDYETKTKYLLPVVNPKSIAFKEVK